MQSTPKLHASRRHPLVCSALCTVEAEVAPQSGAPRDELIRDVDLQGPGPSCRGTEIPVRCAGSRLLETPT